METSRRTTFTAFLISLLSFIFILLVLVGMGFLIYQEEEVSHSEALRSMIWGSWFGMWAALFFRLAWEKGRKLARENDEDT